MTTMDPTALAQRIDAVLKSRGWSERGWSVKAGLGASTLRAIRQRLANGDANPEIDTLTALADAAETTVAYLVGDSPHDGPADREAPARPREPRPPAVQQPERVKGEPRYEAAMQAIEELVAAGYARKKAAAVVGTIAFDEGTQSEPPTAARIVRVALLALQSEKGKGITRELTDDI